MARFCSVAAATVVFMLFGTSSFAAEEDDVGAHTYRRYCGACHGLKGKGDGVVSGFLRPKPPDLTQLAKKHNGQFPLAYVMRIIDGRETLRGHGDPEMPVWGEILKEEISDAPASESAVRSKILLITEHLRRIQEK